MGTHGEKRLADEMTLTGGRPLAGTINVQGAKNAALPVMAAAILLRGQSLRLECVPDLYDIRTMCRLLCHLGAEVEFENGCMTINVPDEIECETPVELVRKMRASSLVLGPLTRDAGAPSCRCQEAATSEAARSTSISRDLRRWARTSSLRAGP